MKRCIIVFNHQWSATPALNYCNNDEDRDVNANGDADRADENDYSDHNNQVYDSRTKDFPQVSKETNARNCDFSVTLDNAVNSSNPVDILNVSIEIVNNSIDKKYQT